MDHIDRASLQVDYLIKIVTIWIPSGTDHGKYAEHKRKPFVYTLTGANISLQIREANGPSHQTLQRGWFIG